MKKILFILSVFLLGILATPAAADDMLRISPAPVEVCTEVLIEPVPLDMIVKYIMFGKFGDDKIGLLSSFVSSLKEEPVSYYRYTVYFSEGEHGSGNMYDSQVLSVDMNPTWTVPVCRFSADYGYEFAGWEIYGNVYQRWDEIVLTDFYTDATALWKKV